jgi:hypothetical protein
MIFRSPTHFLGILFKLKEKKNQIPTLGRDLGCGLRPLGPAACAAGGASRPSIQSSRPGPVTQSNIARAPAAVVAHGPDTAVH